MLNGKNEYLIVIDQPGGICPEAIDCMNSTARVVIPESVEEAELKRLFKEADGILSWGNTRLDEKLLAKCQFLKTIAVTGVGLDNVDLNYAKQREIVVTNTPGANAYAVAEYTLGMMIAVLRNFFPAKQIIDEKKWTSADEFNGVELKSRKIGIIGLGNIGLTLARLLKGFECEGILGFDPYADQNRVKQHGAVYSRSLHRLCEESNMICIHAPLTSETQNLINEKCFKLMGKDTWIINAARAPVVDEVVLYEYLKEDNIGGYITDVFPNEPPELNNPLYCLENVIATPHIAAMTHSAYKEMQVRAAQNLCDVLNGKKQN